uniref:peptidylprolyl isomerase n=1 Tax=Oryza nivara TaxID=4536 RepID=A0A0E0FN90_ORYNI
MQRANRRRQRSRSGRGGRIPGGERAVDAYSRLQVHFTGKRLDGTLFTSTIEDGVPLTFILGQGTKSRCPANIPANLPPNQALQFDVELISLITITDILDNEGILKKDYQAWMNYNACLEDGMSVSMSEGVEFNLAEGFFCPAFARAVETMTEGEEVVPIVKPEYGFGERGRPSIGDEAAVPPDATLYVYLQLMSWKTVRHIGQNGTILKKTLRRGNLEGQHTENQAVVGVRLIGKLHDGAVFDQRGHQGDEPFEFVVDEEQVSDGLEEAVLTMWEGEVSLFTIPPQCLQDQHVVVPPGSSVTYEIELLSCKCDKHPWLMSQAESVEAAVEKEKEECATQLQRFEQAYHRYREVLEYDPGNVKAQEMSGQAFPEASLVIDTAAMHRGLEPFRPKEQHSIGWTTTTGAISSMRLKQGHKYRGGMIFVPPIARPGANVPTSRSPATQATRVVNTNRVTTNIENQINSGTTRKSLGSCFRSAAGAPLQPDLRHRPGSAAGAPLQPNLRHRPGSAAVAPLSLSEGATAAAAEVVTPETKEVRAKASVDEAVTLATVVSKDVSFREESNFLDNLKDGERKVLAELRAKVEEAIVEGKLFDDGKVEAKKKATTIPTTTTARHSRRSSLTCYLDGADREGHPVIEVSNGNAGPGRDSASLVGWKHGEVGLRSGEHDDEGGDDDGDGQPRAGKIVAAEPRHVPVAPHPAVARHVLVQPREHLRVVVHRVDVAQAVEEPRRLLVVVQQVLHHAAPPEQLDIVRRHDELAHQRHVAAQEPGHLAALALLERDQMEKVVDVPVAGRPLDWLLIADIHDGEKVEEGLPCALHAGDGFIEPLDDEEGDLVLHQEQVGGDQREALADIAERVSRLLGVPLEEELKDTRRPDIEGIGVRWYEDLRDTTSSRQKTKIILIQAP